MARASSPIPSDADSTDSLDEAGEVRAIAAAVRGRLRWLESGGTTGLPKPKKKADKLAGPSTRYAFPGPMDAEPTTEKRGVPSVIEHAVPPVLPERPVARPAAPPPAPVPSRAPVIAEAVYPDLPDVALLRGAEGLTTIRRVLGDCRRCKLCHGRNNLVFDDGVAGAWLAFVGEGPGADEDRLGKPFVGAAGQLLDRMIDAMAGEARKRGHEELATHLHRSSVYIANVVKCRPPGNRTPEPDEVSACTPFLRAQLHSLRPGLRAIVALGRTPTQYLLKTGAPIGSLRGRFTDWEGIPVMPTYHPAYLLRTPSAKRQVWEDLQKVLDQLAVPPKSS